jgi:hypothetical protein
MANVIEADNSRILQLEWSRNPSDSSSMGFYLFRINEKGKKVLLGETGLLYESKVNYPIKSKKGRALSFCVASVVNFPEVLIGKCSEVISIDIPSSWIPAPASCANNDGMLSWYYPEIYDLDAFQVEYYQNGNRIDTLVSGKLREFYVEGDITQPRIHAITGTGVLSSSSVFRSL